MSTPDNAFILKAAEEAREQFTHSTRTDGDTYYHRKGNEHDWVYDLCHAAHGDMLPDDYRYEFIVDALDAIIDADGDFERAREEWEPDAYNAGLLKWVSSSLYRMGHVDEAVSEFGWPDDLSRALQLGQRAEWEEVFGSVQASIKERAEEAAEEEE